MQTLFQQQGSWQTADAIGVSFLALTMRLHLMASKGVTHYTHWESCERLVAAATGEPLTVMRSPEEHNFVAAEVYALTSRLLLDNWTLAEAESLLTSGCDPEETASLAIGAGGRTSEWQPVSRAAIQVAALLRLLVDIVTREELIVEPRFLYTWGNAESPLIRLREKQVIVGAEVPVTRQQATQLTEELVDQLCITEQLRADQRKNEEAWSTRREVVHSAQSAVVWGAAGYLMRSHFFGVPYSGHPLRATAIEQTVFREAHRDVTKAVEKWVEDQRRLVFESIVPCSRATTGVMLPPLAVEIIEASSTTGALIHNALQLREEYTGLRKWLAQFQTVVDGGDPMAMAEQAEVLKSVEDNVARRLGRGKDGATAVSISLSWLGVSLPSFAPAEFVKNRLGVRATLNRLIFTNRGEQTLRKLLRLFGEDKSSLGRTVVRFLMNAGG